MTIDSKTIQKVARLSRIRLSDDDVAHYTQELGGILGWIEQLKSVDTANVEPLSSVSAITPRLRADIVNDGGYPERIVANAAESQENFFVVPKVIE